MPQPQNSRGNVAENRCSPEPISALISRTLGRSGAECVHASHARGYPCRHSPPARKVSAGVRKTACPPSRRKFSPRGNAEDGAAGVQRDWPGCCRDAAGVARTPRGCSVGYADLCREACCRLTLSPSGTGCSTGRPPGRDPHDKRVRIGHRPPGGVEGLRTYAGY